MRASGIRNSMISDISQRQDSGRSIVGISNSSGKNGQINSGNNISSMSNFKSPVGITNLNYNLDVPKQQQQVTNILRVFKSL